MRTQNNLLGIRISNDYGILENIFVSLDSEFEITVSLSVIRIKKNLGYLKDFFGENVTSVSGIVGPNGVGKTTLLNYIKSLFIQEKSELRYRENDIVFFKQGNKILIYLNSNRKSDFTIDNETGHEIEILTYHEYPKVFNTIKNKTTVFYANGLDLDQRDTETTNYYNISTSYLLNHPGKINYRQKSSNLKRMSSQKRFRYTELRRQAEFLQRLNDFDHDIPFKRQLYIEVEINEVFKKDYDKLLKITLTKLEQTDDLNYDSLKDFVNLVHDLKYVSNDWKEKCDDRKLPEVKIGENILFQLSIIVINAGFENLSSNELMVSIERFNHLFRAILNSSRLELRSLEEIFDFWESQLTQVQFLEGTSQSMPDDAIRKLGQFKKVWKIAVKLLSNLDQRGRISVISFEGNRAMSLIDDFFSSEISEFVNFKWPKMSAGEEAMLSFYSRLNSVMNNVKTDDLLLLIDEGDLYFHPEWQRKYLFYLLSFLKKSSQQIQVVYTTHSPFLISDLPKENIVLLGQKADSEKFQTFGANLYTLFSKAFFLGEHTTSEFARLKIKTEILDKLKSDKQNSENRNLNVLVDKIGEPVLKTLILNRIKSGSNG